MGMLLAALLIGVVAGMRTFMAPAAVSWAAWLGFLVVDNTPLAFMGYAWTPWILTVLVLIELVVDQLPLTPSRKVPLQFGGRILTGALSGAAIGGASGRLIAGAVLGAAGAVVGTFGGHTVRTRLAGAFRKDAPAALLEDAVAIVAALAIIAALR